MSMPSIGLRRQYDNKQFAVFGTIPWLLSLAVSPLLFHRQRRQKVRAFAAKARLVAVLSLYYQRYQPAPGNPRRGNCPRAGLMSLVPASGPAGLDDQRHRELAMRGAGTFHDRPDDLRSCLDFSFRDLEQQLVMDLQQHAGAQLFAGEGGRDAGHRALDDVGGRTLEGRVDRLPLGAGSARRVGVAD